MIRLRERGTKCERNVVVRCRGGMTSLVMYVLVAYVASGMKCWCEMRCWCTDDILSNRGPFPYRKTPVIQLWLYRKFRCRQIFRTKSVKEVPETGVYVVDSVTFAGRKREWLYVRLCCVREDNRVSKNNWWEHEMEMCETTADDDRLEGINKVIIG